MLADPECQQVVYTRHTHDLIIGCLSCIRYVWIHGLIWDKAPWRWFWRRWWWGECQNATQKTHCRVESVGSFDFKLILLTLIFIVQFFLVAWQIWDYIFHVFLGPLCGHGLLWFTLGGQLLYHGACMAWAEDYKDAVCGILLGLFWVFCNLYLWCLWKWSRRHSVLDEVPRFFLFLKRFFFCSWAKPSAATVGQHWHSVYTVNKEPYAPIEKCTGCGTRWLSKQCDHTDPGKRRVQNPGGGWTKEIKGQWSENFQNLFNNAWRAH